MGEEKVEEEFKAESVRLFVGGLGEKVTSDELHKVFESLGIIHSLDIIRTKGRSFAYIDFLPASHNSLPKLLSTYNGCLWKGGRLRLEKAKEDYLTRLRREWDEDAEVVNAELTSTNIEVDVEKKMNPAEKALQKRSTENKQLRMFFPKLGKVKAIPFNGTGKHKYSFRRVEVPLLPTHFCDCEEHSVAHTVEEKQIHSKEKQDGGMNEEELNRMNSVMNKLFQKEGISNIQMDEVKPAFEEDKSFNSTDGLKFDESGGESTDEEEDNIVINIVRSAVTVKDTQKSRFNENKVSTSGPKKVLEKQKQDSSRKRKLSDLHEENRANEYEFATGGDKETTQVHSNKQGKLVACQSSEPNLGGKELGPNASWSQKSSWKELLGNGGNSAFNISKVIPDISSSKKELPSDNAFHSGSSMNLQGHEDHKLQEDVTAELNETGISDDVPKSTGNEKNNAVGHGDRKPRKEKTGRTKEKPTSHHVSGSSGTEKNVLKHENNEGKQENMEVIEEPAEAMTSNSEPPLNNPGRGSAWLHTSSWTQLLGGRNTNSFSITQVLPDISFGKPADPESKKVDNLTDIKYDDDKAEDNTMELVVSNPPNLGSKKKDDNDDMKITQVKCQQVVEASTSVVEEKRSEETREAYASNITVGETCLFMRSAASLKEWQNAKASLSRSQKRKNNEM